MKYLVAATLLSLSLNANAQGGVSVKTVFKPGVLHEQFNGESLERIRVLKVKGTLNKQDIKFMNSELKVIDLDLSEADFDASVTANGVYPGYLFERMKITLQTLILPPSIKSIADNAFAGMENLQRISFNAPITSIGKNAFRGCVKLHIDGGAFKDAVLIDDFAFYDCESITELQLGSKLNKMGLKAFWNCKSLKKVSIDADNEELLFIPEGAFYNCISLQEVDIPTLVKSIDKTSFMGCRSLETINLRTIVPPMMANNAFDESIHPMTVFVAERSLKLYHRSSTWRKFRNYIVSADAKKIYDKSKEEERIRPTVTLKENEKDSLVSSQSEAVIKDTTLFVTSFTNVKDTVKQIPNDNPATAKPIELPKKQEQQAKGDNKVPEVTNKPVETVKIKSKDTEISKVVKHAPVVKPLTEQKEENPKDFKQVLEERQTVVEMRPMTYFNSKIVNGNVKELVLYIKSGIVHIEAPVVIKQLTLIDRMGRTIYATRLSDTLYSTGIDLSSIKLLRAVYEGGIETKRF